MIMVIKQNAYEIFSKEFAWGTNDDWNKLTVDYYFGGHFQDARQYHKMLEKKTDMRFLAQGWKINSSDCVWSGKNNICMKSSTDKFDIMFTWSF